MNLKPFVFWGSLFIYVISFSGAIFADDDNSEKCEPKCKSFSKSFKLGFDDRDIGDMNVNVDASFLFPMGDFYDRWNDGAGFVLGIDFLVNNYLTAGINFSDVDLSPNPSSFSTDLTDWKTTIYTWSVNPKFYLVPDRLYLSVEGGFSGLRRTIPNYASLSAADQGALEDENSISFFSGLGVAFWNIFLFETGYFHIIDEGGAATIHFGVSI